LQKAIEENNHTGRSVSLRHNTVEAGLVEAAHFWLHSSAGEYSEMGTAKIELMLI